MDPQSKELLEQTHKFAEENNKMLRTIRRHQKVASFMQSVYWVIVISLGIGAFYFLQPYFTKVQNFWQTSSDTISNIKDTFNK